MEILLQDQYQKEIDCFNEELNKVKLNYLFDGNVIAFDFLNDFMMDCRIITNYMDITLYIHPSYKLVMGYYNINKRLIVYVHILELFQNYFNLNEACTLSLCQILFQKKFNLQVDSVDSICVD